MPYPAYGVCILVYTPKYGLHNIVQNATDFAKNLRGDFLRSVVVKLCNSVQRDSARNLHGDFLRNVHGDFLRNLRVDYSRNQPSAALRARFPA